MKVLHHRERIDEVVTAVFVAFDTPEQMRDSLLHEVWGDPAPGSGTRANSLTEKQRRDNRPSVAELLHVLERAAKTS